jgi:hypothetical protein
VASRFCAGKTALGTNQRWFKSFLRSKYDRMKQQDRSVALFDRSKQVLFGDLSLANGI